MPPSTSVVTRNPPARAAKSDPSGASNCTAPAAPRSTKPDEPDVAEGTGGAEGGAPIKDDGADDVAGTTDTAGADVRLGAVVVGAAADEQAETSTTASAPTRADRTGEWLSSRSGLGAE